MASGIFVDLWRTAGGWSAQSGLWDPRHLAGCLALSLPEEIRSLIVRYAQFIWHLVEPLGVWAVFAVAAMDSAFFGFPLDPLVAGFVYRDNSGFLLYSVMAAAGSAAGSIVVYVIGYKGGEVLLAKRIPARKFDRIRSSFDRHEFWALMLPSMLPPPFPFKLFLFAASVFEMNFYHFLLAIFAGRMVRFLLLSVLVMNFGEQAVRLAGLLVVKPWFLLLLALAATGIYGWLWLRSRRRSDERALGR